MNMASISALMSCLRHQSTFVVGTVICIFPSSCKTSLSGVLDCNNSASMFIALQCLVSYLFWQWLWKPTSAVMPLQSHLSAAVLSLPDKINHSNPRCPTVTSTVDWCEHQLSLTSACPGISAARAVLSFFHPLLILSGLTKTFCLVFALRTKLWQ